MSYDTEEINIANKNLSALPNLSRFIYLKKLNCSLNRISSLDNLPNSLIELYCNDNNITNLDNLPNKLKILDCSRNNIRNLNNLPKSIEVLKYYGNPL